MSNPFNHEIEIYGITLTVTGTYYPEERGGWNEPSSSSIVDIERVSVQGSDVNIYDLLCEKSRIRIEETIDRLEANS